MSGYEADTDSEVESLVLLQEETSSCTESTRSDACCECEKESDWTLSDSSASDEDYDADDEQDEKFGTPANETYDADNELITLQVVQILQLTKKETLLSLHGHATRKEVPLMLVGDKCKRKNLNESESWTIMQQIKKKIGFGHKPL
ncbi:uncharacterized protein LOC135687412 isoform X2 [Rhopilema esculentum]|uniref:uncharacterized protein LOC135687412 isoform X2 n=1 Tax=Rhopilema esculentum TaxID=499914 RepID=UPI0031E40C41